MHTVNSNATDWPVIYDSHRFIAQPRLDSARVHLTVHLRTPQIIARKSNDAHDEPLVMIKISPLSHARMRHFIVDVEIEGWTYRALQTREFANGTAEVTYSPDFFSNRLPLQNSVKAPLHVRVLENGPPHSLTPVLLYESKREIWLLPSDSLLYGHWNPVAGRLEVCQPPLYLYFKDFKSEFQAIKQQIYATGSIPLLDDPDPTREKTIQGLYQLLAEHQLTYVRSLNIYYPEKDNIYLQRVRSPRRIWEDRHFNCIEGVLFMLGLFHQLDLGFPVGAVLDRGHALFAWQTVRPTHDWEYLELTLLPSCFNVAVAWAYFYRWQQGRSLQLVTRPFDLPDERVPLIEG